MGNASLGILIGLPISFLVVVGCLLFAYFAGRDSWDGDLFRGVGIAGASLSLVITAFAMWPYKWEYHSWQPVKGKVERINKRLLSTDSGVQTRYVVVVGGQPYGIDDTRASLLKVGSYVEISCKREYQWGSSDNGYGCRWGA